MPSITRPPISAYHKRVLAIGLPLICITPFFWTAASFSALAPSPDNLSRQAAFRDRVVRTFTGEGSINDQLLVASQVFFVVWVVSTVVTIVLVALPTFRDERRAKRGPQLDLGKSLQDMAFWQVGDRVGWRDDSGRVHTGVVTETHRRPFTFGGEQVDAVAGIPALVVKDDGTGELVARRFGSAYRIAGTTGASGTIESIRDEMHDAVQVGDSFAWIDRFGFPAEGVVVEIHHKKFEVAGVRIDAAAKRPGYTVKRATDDVLVGIGDDLRERV